jgi:predicted nucleotidyltransferase
VSGMVQVDRDAVARRIADVCASHREIVAAYLFGSALGDMRPDSDIDVGVILRPCDPSVPDAAFRRELGLVGELEAALGGHAGHRFQVTIFKASVDQSFFVVNALRDAALAYVADPEALTDFLERVAYLHRRDGPRHWAALAEVSGWDPRSIRRG